eukprot:TRINITY_DN572_c0_g1_i6.p2 TRINITY_DN572_c0_g1~~TRINITY_DN572_c0_g1_i6.p2  ORF type:complete len:113 (-),score=6.65 TRINITY_DN572_c0_g1_i6:31-369(-)
MWNSDTCFMQFPNRTPSSSSVPCVFFHAANTRVKHASKWNYYGPKKGRTVLGFNPQCSRKGSAVGQDTPPRVCAFSSHSGTAAFDATAGALLGADGCPYEEQRSFAGCMFVL